MPRATAPAWCASTARPATSANMIFVSPACFGAATSAPTSGSSRATSSSSPKACSDPMGGLYDQLRIAFHQVWRRRWLAMGVAWGLCVLGWLVIALIPSSYEAKARLFVQMQSILPNQIGISPDTRNNQLLRLKQTLTSNENLVRVIRRTDLNSLVSREADLPAIVSGLRLPITITAQPDG